MPNESETKLNQYTTDKDFDLISVLYHALQGADKSSQYTRDAESDGSQEVADFLREVQQQYLQIAQQAKELLLKQKQV